MYANRCIFICISAVIYVGNAIAQNASTPVEDRSTQQDHLTAVLSQDILVRLGRLEQILDNKTLLDLFDQLKELKNEVSTLRGDIEIQAYKLEQLKQKQMSMYSDIEQRLQQSNNSSAPIQATTASLSTPPSTALASEIPAPITNKPDETIMYQQALQLLKESQYDKALQTFKKFLSTYPNSSSADNAQYWLAEIHYLMQKYQLAINEYQILLNTYPSSHKISLALLKIGYSYTELGNAKEAKKLLEEVRQKYPGTTAAQLASEQLRKISIAEKANN